MTRLLSGLALVGILAVGLIGCSNSDADSGPTATPTASTPQTPGANKQQTNTMAPTMNPAAGDPSALIGSGGK